MVEGYGDDRRTNISDEEVGNFIAEDLIPEEIGPNRTARFPTAAKGVAGHLYEGAPAPEGAGPTIHLMFDGPLETALERVWEAGGKVVSDPISIPDGRFAYTLDPDGNSIGLFEAA